MDFYDIAMRTASCFSVNPWKSRLALNFKKIEHATIWVPVPDIARVRRALDIPACRKFADGTDFFTLPILVDPSTEAKIGDSFDIAVYLQETYPASGAGDLFPRQVLNFTFDQDLPPWAPRLSERKESQHEEYSRFNTHIDAAFSAHVGLVGHRVPLDSELSKDEFVRRAGVASWDDFEVKGREREKLKESFHLMLGGLSDLFSKDATGPFLLGNQASYADFIVGGWLYMMRGTLPEDEWQEVRVLNEGTFGRLYDGLKEYGEVK